MRKGPLGFAAGGRTRGGSWAGPRPRRSRGSGSAGSPERPFVANGLDLRAVRSLEDRLPIGDPDAPAGLPAFGDTTVGEDSVPDGLQPVPAFRVGLHAVARDVAVRHHDPEE